VVQTPAREPARPRRSEPAPSAAARLF
jgi:hypothetical protein